MKYSKIKVPAFWKDTLQINKQSHFTPRVIHGVSSVALRSSLRFPPQLIQLAELNDDLEERLEKG